MVIANFLELATCASQQLSLTIKLLSAAIVVLYELLNLFPTCDLLICCLRQALVRDRTKWLVNHGRTFDLSSLAALFRDWGPWTTPSKTRAKLIALLCMLGALQVSAATLPFLDSMSVQREGNKEALIMPVSGYKNDLHSNGHKVIIFECAEEALCPVATFRHWKAQTTRARAHIHGCRLVFELEPPYAKLSPTRCVEVLKGVAHKAGLDPNVFTARTFRKSGIMAGIHAGVEPDALFRLGGWQDPDTFWRHYVVRQIPSSYTDILFNVPERHDTESEEESD
ncbi:uncharacterized protein ACA1_305790 [Acanthamoeba castellanii str. Neff]|uniref:Tyr recombinase domain-containing protein n=1 Tax=Acanthamoeba castellanii (strain ATCC 30010 / Neff) TaxID=1257118 RepID=L8GKF9_ACACF|nr:uncharacterized protein ACA1_305790 [Acanthamoeba castellanii str. Neff]ELR13555.1 hypothetical protein ACA1_305790 [Acanthamoeba castellanii str. Neff]